MTHILDQLAGVDGNSLELTLLELQQSLETGILSDIETNTQKQALVQKELADTQDTDIERMFVTYMHAEKTRIEQKKANHETLFPWEQKLLDVYAKFQREIEDFVQRNRKNEAFPQDQKSESNVDTDISKETPKKTAEILEQTDLLPAMVAHIKREKPTLSDQEAIKEAKELCEKLDNTRYAFIDSYFPSDENDPTRDVLATSVKRNLATGLSFAFMHFYNEHYNPTQEQALPPGSQGRSFLDTITAFSEKIGKYFDPLMSVASGGVEVFSGILGGIGMYAKNLPLQIFFRKIQNAVSIVQTHQTLIQANEQGKGTFLNSPSKVVTFFTSVCPGDRLLTPSELRSLSGYFTKENQVTLQDADLLAIANQNAAKAWSDKEAKETYTLLTRVVNKAPSILDARKDLRSTALGLYEQLDTLVSKLGSVVTTLFGENIGSVKELFGKLGRVGNTALFLLGFNGVDDLARTYWYQKIPGFTDEQNDLLHDTVSRYRYASSITYKYKQGTKEVDWEETNKQEGAFLPYFSSLLQQQNIDLSKVPTIVNGKETPVDIRSKLPLSFPALVSAIAETFQEETVFYVDETFDTSAFDPRGVRVTEEVVDGKKVKKCTITDAQTFAQHYVQKMSSTLLTDKEFLEAVAANDEFGPEDFVIALVGSLFAPGLSFSKACAYGALDAVAYGNKNLEAILLQQKKQANQTQNASQNSVENNQQQQEVLPGDYAENVWKNLQQAGLSLKVSKATFLDRCKLIQKEAEKYPTTKGKVPRILAMFHHESGWDKDAFNTQGECSIGLGQIFVKRHLDKVVSPQSLVDLWKNSGQDASAIPNEQIIQIINAEKSKTPPGKIELQVGDKVYDILSPEGNIQYAIWYLSERIQKNGGSIEMGLRAYNTGDGGVYTEKARNYYAAVEKKCSAYYDPTHFPPPST